MRNKVAIGLTILAMTVAADRVQAQPPGGGGPVNIMQFVDTDKDGKISQTEYTAFSEARWTRMAQGADKLKVADLQPRQQNAFAGITAGADGTVTKDAYLAAIPARFKAADANGDGSLSEAELTASMPPRPAAN